jgi:hypothetical protein
MAPKSAFFMIPEVNEAVAIGKEGLSFNAVNIEWKPAGLPIKIGDSLSYSYVESDGAFLLNCGE